MYYIIVATQLNPGTGALPLGEGEITKHTYQSRLGEINVSMSICIV